MLICEIAKVQDDEVEKLAQLAKEIWTEHFPTIIGEAQTQYMLDNIQSEKAMVEQIQEGYLYYFLKKQGEPVGYMSIRLQKNKMFLSKLYVRKEFRQQHIAREGLAFIERLCKAKGLNCIWLTVNKYNAGSIQAYNKMGFRIINAQKADIGGGFIMDDFIMEKEVI